MYLQRADTRLFYQSWCVDQPQAVVVISHGLGEHSGRYAHVADYLNTCGYTVYALDHRGHGQSDGQRGHVNSFQEYSDDLHALFLQLAERHPGLTMHLLGHSMGALIATAYVLRHSGVGSLILSAPAYAAAGWSKRLEVCLSQYLAPWLPRVSIPNGINADAVSRSTTVVQAYRDDPRVHDRVTPAWGAGFYREQRFVAEHVADMRIPVLMLLAGADSLTDASISQRRFEGFASSDKQLEFYPNAYHEIFNEDHEQVLALQRIGQWLLCHD